MTRLRIVLSCICVGLCLPAVLWAQSPELLLNQIPADARGFVVVRGLDATRGKVDALAARFRVPPPNLNEMAAAIEKGVDKQRSFGVAWLPERDGDDFQSGFTHFVLYIPVKDYAEFIAQLDGADANTRIAEVAFAGQSMVVAHKGDFAIIARLEDRASLDHVLNSERSIHDLSQPLHQWLDGNDVTLSLSPSGTSLLFAKLKEGLEMIKVGAADVPGAGAEMVKASLDMYRSFFDAAEKEFTQFAVGIRVAPDKSIEIHKRLLLSPDSGLVDWSSDLTRPDIAWLGLPAGPFVMTFEGAIPSDWSQGMMAQSFNMLKSMQGPNATEITPQQMKQITDAAAQSMKGVRSMAFAMGVGAPGSSMYSRTIGVLQVDNATAYLLRYESEIAKLAVLMNSAKLPGGYAVERVQIGDLSALHMTVDITSFQNANAAAMPEMKRVYEAMFGPEGTMSIYMAPASDTAIVLAYISPDNLTEAITAYRSGKSGLADDPHVQTTQALLPRSAQWSGLISPPGMMKFVMQMTSAMNPEANLTLPEFPASPPLGFAAELTRTYLDGVLVVPMETVDAVLQMVAAVRERGQ